MFKFFEKLRSKPREKRQIFAIGFSLVITAFIFTFWAFIFTQKTPNVLAENKVTNKDDTISPSPLTSLRNGFDGLTDTAFEGFSGLKEKINTFLPEVSEQIQIDESSITDSEELEISSEVETEEESFGDEQTEFGNNDQDTSDISAETMEANDMTESDQNNN